MPSSRPRLDPGRGRPRTDHIGAARPTFSREHAKGAPRRVLVQVRANDARRVFLVATANDIEALPPELLRKGRVDEIFFVYLPTPEIRERILGIHLAKRDIAEAAIDVVRVAGACEGFSGSEIEQLVVSALYAAHVRSTPLRTEALLEEVERTRPLLVVMAERIDRLRAWAAERTVPAG